MTQQIDWLAISPPLVLAVGAVLVLLVDAFVGAPVTRRATLLPAGLTVLAVVVASLPVVLLWDDPRATFCVPRQEELCSYGVNGLTVVFWGVVLFGTAVVALVGTVGLHERHTPAAEWNFLLLCSATGALSIAAARDLVTVVVALELVSLPAFAMAGLRRGDPRAAEAAVKFFLVSVVSTAVMLMGTSLVYGATGSVFLSAIDGVLSGGDAVRGVTVVGVLLTFVGLGFKVAVVPFHMWVPDTYVGAPVAVAAYLSVVSKAAGFVGLVLVLEGAAVSLADSWAPVVGVAAAVTMTAGNVLALWQRHAVRLLAWSSVAQSGYVLVPFGAVAAASQVPEAAGATVGYLVIYAVVNLGAFAVVAVVGARHPGQQLDDYRGLVREAPGLGWPLAFALLALAGLPPAVIGLVAKVVVLDALAGPATWLAVVMALNVAVGLVYYVRWLRVLFLPPVTAGHYAVPGGAAAAVAMTFVLGVVFSVLPGALLDPVLAALR